MLGRKELARVTARCRAQEILQSPQFAIDAHSVECRHCKHKFKSEGGRVEHEKWCEHGPRPGRGDAPLNDDGDSDDDCDDTLLCDVCGREVGGVNAGARATHRKACLARRDALGENFAPSLAAALAASRDRVRRQSHSLAYKQRALFAVQLQHCDRSQQQHWHDIDLCRTAGDLH